MNLNDYRLKIDEIDNELVRLFVERMEVAAGVSLYKQQNGLAVYDPQREQQKQETLAEKCPPEFRKFLKSLYSQIFELSRAYQKELFPNTSPLKQKILEAALPEGTVFPRSAVVACQGVQGAFSEAACRKIFAEPEIHYYKTFEDVCKAVDQGECRYGILPIENSTAGPVTANYDLMVDHRFYITRGTRVKVEHCLLAAPGVQIGDIKEVFSHEQALAQCKEYLKTLPGVKLTACENTAAAARYIAESGRTDAAALSSLSCAELYGLNCLQPSVQDQQNNYTRFICISKKAEIYPDADKTMLMMVLPHQPGSLYKILSRFEMLGINLLKIQSRPIPNSDFEFTFYFELDSSVLESDLLQVICTLEDSTLSMRCIGSYKEVL